MGRTEGKAEARDIWWGDALITGDRTSHARETGRVLKNALFARVTQAELDAVDILEKARPASLRDFDQIPMRGTDLLCQVKLVAAQLTNKSVAFVGDYDGTSLLIGLLYSRGLKRPPARMVLFDFDERLLIKASHIAAEHGFSHLLETRPYNAFDPIPNDLLGEFDVFYTNPPYGASNMGASARLFITRGCELVSKDGGAGYMLLPSDQRRPWTRQAMHATQQFLTQYGWTITTQIPGMHRYHLDDDRSLISSLVIAEREVISTVDFPTMPWAGRHVEHTEIPNFYGRGVLPPFPKYIAADGYEVYSLDVPSSIV